jgi:hypothetical protein
MISATLLVDPQALERQTGWAIKPEGACKAERCVPLNWSGQPGEPLDLRRFAERLGMPLVHDSAMDLWCLGPEAGGRALSSAVAPALSLPDLDGVPFDLATLRGQNVLLVAWASW